MLPSSLAIMGKDVRPSERDNTRDMSPEKSLKKVQEFLDKNFDDVGDKFAEIALKIHHGEEDRRNIKGTTTEREEENLSEEGVQFFKIPMPKFDS